MQQPGQMFPVTPSFPSTNITTEQIQKYLDENKKLILAILDNQNLGKLAECAQYQVQLQKNLMYLAAIADAQPQTTPSPLMPPPVSCVATLIIYMILLVPLQTAFLFIHQHMQMTPRNAMQQGGLYMSHPQALAMSQQPGAFAQRAPFSIPHPMQDPRHQLPQQLHPQSTQGLMTMWPVGATNGMSPMHNISLGGVNSILPTLNPANKQEKPESGATPKSDGQGSTDGDKAK
ncbi:GRF1-interacting factor 2-like isoform X1 [Primulina huaijiensis]|uniref:GRF1-interacting factor 2-like isoform X1 n=1 Tax=Primulina huaijiensis TaxID=1492673 RepID=UPI003CC762E5